ncbi:RNA polymerase sigma factor [Sorangium sp. So ce131]|uniref:RNA polymerase sigma factor n=1 Tax=Sorangium sp. So ce131 TaxID=3133282 RepID=UPI003F61ECA1
MHAAADSRGQRLEISPAPCAEAAMGLVLDGDDRAFAAVYRALAPRVQRLLERLSRNPALADDLTQETFLRMFRARAGYRRGEQVLPWAATIARRLFIEHLRRARHEQLDAPDVVDRAAPPGTAAAPDEEIAARRMAEAVARVLDGLPVRQGEAFRLVREEGCSLQEVAARLGCSEMAARLCAHRARTSIRRHLDEAWGLAG